jgi:hypothetical protein
MNGKSAKISGPRPLPSTFFSLLHSTIRRFIVWTIEEQREMETDYSGGQSSPWAVAPMGRKEGGWNMSAQFFDSFVILGMGFSELSSALFVTGFCTGLCRPLIRRIASYHNTANCSHALSHLRASMYRYCRGHSFVLKTGSSEIRTHMNQRGKKSIS